MSRIVFVDTETTGLDPLLHEVWEIALIERREDGDYPTHLFVKPQHLETADANALQVNRFYERTHDFADAPSDKPGQQWSGIRTAARKIARITTGAVLVGSNPAYDALMLNKLLRSQKMAPAWHYRPICVATMAYGYLHGTVAEHNVGVEDGVYKDAHGPAAVEAEAQHPAFSSRGLSLACGIDPPVGDAAHTAMADADWVRRWYDALVGGTA